MTSDSERQSDDAFRGLMRNLNLDESQFKTYVTNFAQLSFQQLESTKREIEGQLSTLFDLLKNNYKADMDTPLVIDGFPRSDIDVVGIRLVRVKIIRLRNDLKRVLELIEEKLIETFSKEPRVETQETPVIEELNTSPFATVNLVVENGPAHTAGLREGDRIISFANITKDSENKLPNISVVTRNNLEKSIRVVVARESEGPSTQRLVLSLVPTDKWSGKGVLGCQLKVD